MSEIYISKMTFNGKQCNFKDADARTSLQGKQDTINDLDAIRSGAQVGATAYQMPATGIPATDLASDVQSDLAAIESIEEVIPEQASSSNKLADKNFVNSSVATATATYRGAYNLVTDLHLSVSATHAQIATALATAIQTADNNDYCYVQILVAEATPTEFASVERYKFGTAWEYEYTLNNSGFTAAQWAALNSGITSGLVAKLSALPTNSELATLLSGKADTADLAEVATSGSYNDLTDKPTIQDLAALKYLYALDNTNPDYPSMRGSYVQLNKTCDFGTISIVNVTSGGVEYGFTNVIAQSIEVADYTIDGTLYTSYLYNSRYYLGIQVPFFTANVAQYGNDNTFGVVKFTSTQKGVFKVHSIGLEPRYCTITVNGNEVSSLDSHIVKVSVNIGDVVKITSALTTSTNVRIVGFVFEGSCGVSMFNNDAGYVKANDLAKKADKVSTATNGNFASLDRNGNLKDSGHKHSDYLTEANVGNICEEKITFIAVASLPTNIPTNSYYSITSSKTSLAITLPSSSLTAGDTVGISFTTGSSITTPTVSGGTVSVYKQDGWANFFEANTTYEIVALYDGGKWLVSAAKFKS